VGSSERNLATILTAVEQEPACVLLIDEIEKLFGESDDSGVTYRLLAQLLWFLQEHKNRIFTVMTTNDKSKLPPELYREGRIDKVLTLGTLGLVEGIELAQAVAAQYVQLDHNKKQLISNMVSSLQSDSKPFTPARITSEMYDLIKQSGWIDLDKP
jgi:ATP-dependent 26S proteasome regulatory subunit